MRRDRVIVAGSDAEREDAFAVRRTVFVDEQGVPADLEWDEHDETATHFVAYDRDGRAVGAARLREYEDAAVDTDVDAETADADADGARVGKVERVAVLDGVRGENWGRRLMDRLESTAAADGFDVLRLHSQTHAALFYEKLGYERFGEEFVEADIPHVKMQKSL